MKKQRESIIENPDTVIANLIRMLAETGNYWITDENFKKIVSKGAGISKSDLNKLYNQYIG